MLLFIKKMQNMFLLNSQQNKYKKLGVFGIYKPKGPTSNHLLNIIRRTLQTKKVGHAGTLDPLASGVLVVGIGKKGTKQLSALVQKEKEYIAKIKFGTYSTTDDEEGIKEDINVTKTPNKKDVKTAIKKFVGNILQTPPIYSAIKIKGKEAYKYARNGIEVEMKPRPAIVKKIKLLKYEWPFLEIKVVTGPGVYVRSLARDIGKELNVGGYLADLERTRVGVFKKSGAYKVEDMGKLIKDYERIPKTS